MNALSPFRETGRMRVIRIPLSYPAQAFLQQGVTRAIAVASAISVPSRRTSYTQNSLINVPSVLAFLAIARTLARQ
jgi:hypothetical protein